MSDHSAFHTGSIISIRMVNFMTFSDITFNASPKLNIILGQNGSGKSTITCAVCLALGEDPKLLLRGSKIEEFIKYGENQARVQLLLRGDSKDILIGLVINKSSSASYSLNNTPTRKESIKELRKVLGIDLSNLCQFLPQDRVADFVNQNPQTRLREFEKSVGGNEFYMNHTQLIDYQQNQNSINTKITQKEQRIETEKQINASLKREKEKMEARNELVKRKQLITTHISMLEYDSSIRQYGTIRDDVKKIKRDLKEEDEKHAELKNTITEYKNSVNHLQQIISEEERKLMRIRGKATKLTEDNQRLYNDYNRDYKTYQNIDKKRLELMNELKKLQKEGQDIERHLETMEDIDTIRQRIGVINEEIASLKDQKMEKMQESVGLESERRNIVSNLNSSRRLLDRLTNKDNAKLRNLEMTDGDTFRALVWLNNNRGLFKMTIYGPIMNEVSFTDNRACQWFENTIAKDTMLSFVTQCNEDYDLFVREVRERMNYRVSVISVDEMISLNPSLNQDRMKDLNVTGFLGDLINCPDAIRRALFNNTALRNIFIAKDSWKLPSNPDELVDLLDNENGLIVLNNTQQFRVRPSRYVNTVTKKREVSLQVSPLRECKIMENHELVDKEEIERINQSIQEATQKLAEVEEKMKHFRSIGESFDKKIHQKENERNGCEEKKQKRARLQNQRRNLARNISGIEEELSKDFEHDKQELKERLQSLLTKQTELIKKREKVVLELLEVNICKEAIQRVYSVQEEKLSQLEESFSGYLHQRSVLEGEKERLEKERESLKQKIAKMKTFIYYHSGLFKCPVHENRAQCNDKCKTEPTSLLDDVKNMNFPTDIDACKAELHVVEDKIREIRINESTIREFEEREVLIKKLEEELKKLKEEGLTLSSTMEAKERNFKEHLTRLVDKLNANFILFMSNIKCKGKVELENPENFRQIGLDVKVSFRADQELQSLNGQVQSGGEKSLSTVLYLLSLQEMVSFPFRFIDEINQNMDKRNERYVMQQLLARGKQKGTAPQTFVITPKLLSEFPMNDQVTFHIIFQGQYLPPNFNWKTLSLYYDKSEKREREREREETE